jgi:hypothetical protein
VIEDFTFKFQQLQQQALVTRSSVLSVPCLWHSHALAQGELHAFETKESSAGNGATSIYSVMWH